MILHLSRPDPTFEVWHAIGPGLHRVSDPYKCPEMAKAEAEKVKHEAFVVETTASGYRKVTFHNKRRNCDPLFDKRQAVREVLQRRDA